MENVNCCGPIYRKVEVRGRKETRRSETMSSRASSTESFRRSLTPTRITQPTPTPWTATVTTNSNVYKQSEGPEEVCKKYCELHMREEITDSDHEEKRSYCEKYIGVSESEPEPEPEMYTCTCACSTKTTETIVEAQSEPKGLDYSKLIPPDVAICPKGIEGEHDLYTETTEKDIGDFHIKRTTTYEKTVELVSPDEAPQVSKTDVSETRTTTEKGIDRSQIESTVNYVSSKIDTVQMVEHAKHADEEEAKEEELKEMKRRQLEEQRRWDEERRQREEEEKSRREEDSLRMKEEEERKWREELENRVRKQEEDERRKKEGCTERYSDERIVDIKIEERTRPYSCDRIVDMTVDEHPPSQEHVIDEKVEGRPPSRERIINVELERDKPTQPQYEKYEEINEEIKNEESKEEQRKQSLREQVKVHQSLREQQVPEKRPTLQERRLSARFQKNNVEQSESTETSCKKHVQFIKQTERGPVPLPATSPVKNATPKEWKSPMLNALTTAPKRAYSPLSTESNKNRSESTTKQLYSREISYEERYGPPEPELPLPEIPPNRPVSPFQKALITAPERSITPLGKPDDQLFRNRAETPTFSNTTDGYCPPAQLLYSETRHRECTFSKREIPRPLPTPPPDFQLRSRSISPSRSRPPTPRKFGGKNEALRKPDVIPSYQRNLITVRSVPLNGQTFDPSRTPTPTPRCTKSPAQGPPDVPVCMRASRDQQKSCCKQESIRQNRSENVHYHSKEETPTSHKSQTYTKHVNFYEDDHADYKHIHHHRSRESSVEERFEENGNLRNIKKTRSYGECTNNVEQKLQVSNNGSETAVEKGTTSELQNYRPEPGSPNCYIDENTTVRVTLPCPVGRPSGAEKFPRTGVRVFPPRASQPEVRRIAHEIPKKQLKQCPQTGVQVIPCKAYSDSGNERAGVVVVPCEESNASCKQSGVCITPTPDRSALFVSPCPAQAGGICEKPSCYCGAGIGTCNSVEVNNLGINTSHCKSIGVLVKPCPDRSSFRVESFDIPGVRPVQAPKPILKPAKQPNCPFPQIPLPTEGPPSSCASCPKGCSKVCPPQSSKECERSFEPIQKPRTNLGSQLTRLTTRPVKKPTIQLYKTTPQPQPLKTQESYSRTEFMSKTVTSSSCQDQNHCPASNVDPPNLSSHPNLGGGVGGQGSKSGGSFAGSSAPKRGKGILTQAGSVGSRQPLCAGCKSNVRGPFISALGQIWCPEHFICVNAQCNRQLQDIGFVEEKGQLYCEYCFERFIAPACNKCNQKVKGDCLNAIGKTYHPECFNCAHCGKLFGNNPFFLEEGLPYCEGDWNNLFTTKCFTCGFPVEAGDRWVEALNNNYHSQCFNCTMCKKNLEGQSFYAKGGRPFCKNHAR